MVCSSSANLYCKYEFSQASIISNLREKLHWTDKQYKLSELTILYGMTLKESQF